MPGRAIYRFLGHAAGHRRIAGTRLRDVELRDLQGGGIAGAMVIRGPLGLRRSARIRTESFVEPHAIRGTAWIGRGTRAEVAWELNATQTGGTRVVLRATVLAATRLDELLLGLGGASWMRGIFLDTLARLATEVDLQPESSPPLRDVPLELAQHGA